MLLFVVISTTEMRHKKRLLINFCQLDEIQICHRLIEKGASKIGFRFYPMSTEP